MTGMGDDVQAIASNSANVCGPPGESSDCLGLAWEVLAQKHAKERWDRAAASHHRLGRKVEGGGEAVLDRAVSQWDSMCMAQPAQTYEHYTWDDYRSWPDDERWEIVGGQAFAMSPSPGSRHQKVCLRIGAALEAALRGQPCEAFIAPLDVKLSNEDIVQPDVLVVCDPRKVIDTHIEGAPDVVMEVASPSTTVHDRLVKLRLYVAFGVKEYWIVTPDSRLVEVLVTDGDSSRIHGVFGPNDTLASPTLSDLELPLDTVFDFPTPEGEHVNEVREPPPPYPARASRS